MADKFIRIADTTSLERELARRAPRPRASARELSALCAESEAALEDLRRLVVRYQEVQQDSAATQARIAAIGASNTWRAVEALRRVKRRASACSAAPRPGRSGARPRDAATCRRSSADRAARRQRRRLSRHRERHGRGRAREHPLARGGRHPGRAQQRRRRACARRTGRTPTPSSTDNPHPFNLVHLNADNMGWFAAGAAARYFRDRYTIGYWFWELSTFRDEWLPFFGYVDEVWVASEFVRAGVRGLVAGAGRAHAAADRAAADPAARPRAFRPARRTAPCSSTRSTSRARWSARTRSARSARSGGPASRTTRPCWC